MVKAAISPSGAGLEGPLFGLGMNGSDQRIDRAENMKRRVVVIQLLFGCMLSHAEPGFDGLDQIDPKDLGLEKIDTTYLLGSRRGSEALKASSVAIFAKFLPVDREYEGFSLCPDGLVMKPIRRLDDKELEKVKLAICDMSNFEHVYAGFKCSDEDTLGIEVADLLETNCFVRVYFFNQFTACSFYSSTGERSEMYWCSKELRALLTSLAKKK